MLTSARMVLEKGGDWLGAVRAKVQVMFRNGETVHWGTPEKLEPSATMDQIELLAAAAVAAERNSSERVEKAELVGAIKRLLMQLDDTQIRNNLSFQTFQKCTCVNVGSLPALGKCAYCYAKELLSRIK